jgi:hypothetical protein
MRLDEDENCSEGFSCTNEQPDKIEPSKKIVGTKLILLSINVGTNTFPLFYYWL